MQKNQMIALDIQFCEESCQNGAKAWEKYFALNGRLVRSGRKDLIGPEAVYRYMEELYSQKSFKFYWIPLVARLSEDKTLAYTYGTYEMSFIDSKANAKYLEGKYTSVWEKQEDNTYKIILDIGN